MEPAEAPEWAKLWQRLEALQPPAPASRPWLRR
jgi:hypothetical protein